MPNKNIILKLYANLLSKYPDPAKLWPQWCMLKKDERTRDLTAIGAVLTQRTSWYNANIALKNLKKANLLSLSQIAELQNLDKLSSLIRPAGFFQTKPKRLYDLACFLVKNDFKVTRDQLLNLKGIGPETADTIMLYALGQTEFVIDEYTKRFVVKNNLSQNLSYDCLKKLFEKNLPKSIKVYQNYHVLIIVDQKGLTGSLMEEV